MKLVILRGWGELAGGADAAWNPDAQGEPGKGPSLPASLPRSTRSRGALALSAGGAPWVLLNVSPTVAFQLETDPRLRAHVGLPDAQVRSVVLTDAQVDHVAGLLGLRDGPPIELYATPAVFEDLTDAMPVLPVLQHYCGVQWRVIPVAGECRRAGFRVEGLPGIDFVAVATDHAVAPYSSHHGSPQAGDTIALAVHDETTGQRLFCAQGLGNVGEIEFEWMQGADCVLLGTGETESHATESAHPDLQQVLDQLSGLRARRKLLLAPAGQAPGGVEGRALRGELAQRGIELAFDGMEIDL